MAAEPDQGPSLSADLASVSDADTQRIAASSRLLYATVDSEGMCSAVQRPSRVSVLATATAKIGIELSKGLSFFLPQINESGRF